MTGTRRFSGMATPPEFHLTAAVVNFQTIDSVIISIQNMLKKLD
jgi:hypothetical protein